MIASRCGRSVVEDENLDGVFILLASGSVMCSDCHSASNAGGIKASKGNRSVAVSNAVAADGFRRST